MKILRLSLFDLKKNKKEAAAIAFLTMVTTLMLAVFIANNAKADKGYDVSFAASGSYSYCVAISDEKYRDEYRDILESKPGVHGVTEDELLAAVSKDVEKDGETLAYSFIFVTEKTERRIEDFVKRDKLPDEEIEKLAHPIWLPVTFQLSEGYETGEIFTMESGGIKYDFEVAGFYETGLMSKVGYKCVVSDSDYAMLRLILNGVSEGRYTALWFDCDEQFSTDDYLAECSESSCEDIESCTWCWDIRSEKTDRLMFIKMFLNFLAFFSAITMLAALMMIMHRISDDIEDHMQQIGVLEALGYRSRDISLSYMGEYLICGGSGALLGGVLALCISPLMDSGLQKMMGRTISSSVEPLKVLIAVAAVTALVIVTALARAAKIRKYPPVVAFRKGIRTHHFGKDILPMEKTRGSVNLMLALKSSIGDVRSLFGVALCVIVSSVAILFCANIFSIFREGADGLMRFLGTEMTIDVDLVSGADPYAVRDEITKMPEVRKAWLSYVDALTSQLHVKGSEYPASLFVYDDYRDTENIFLVRGRFPEHDNEALICLNRCGYDGIDIGDSIVLEGNGVENKYIVTGVTSSMLNSGRGVYLTTEGYLRTEYNAHPKGVSIYLNEGADEDAFREKLYSVFGKSVRDSLNAADNGGSLEERIRAEADKKLAALISYYGVTNADYAVVAGDQVLTGSSRGFVVKDITSLKGTMKQQIQPVAEVSKNGALLFMAVVAGIVAVILSLIVSGTVKRQRKNLGIMKGLGYSSKDLITQITLKTMPLTIISVIIALALLKTVYNAFWSVTFGIAVNLSLPMTIGTCIGLAVFCYAVTYICACRVKAVSVTELMTE